VKLEDPKGVREEYASERRLAVRKAAHRFGEGPSAVEIAFEAVAQASPLRVLEVGCGEGELAERIARELSCELVAIDQSERMIELTRARDVDARVGDVRALPFDAGVFDCAVAAWMLYHVREIDQAISELARVLRPRGRLVAVTNGPEHLRELADLLAVELPAKTFAGENGEELLRRRFDRVERRNAYGWMVFPDRRAAQAYVDATIVLGGGRLPYFDGPLRVRRAPVVFVADK
jgi:SAM-dependent methyltransferase